MAECRINLYPVFVVHMSFCPDYASQEIAAKYGASSKRVILDRINSTFVVANTFFLLMEMIELRNMLWVWRNS